MRHRLRPRGVVPRPSTRPPRGDFPQPPARRLPRHGALGRALQPIRRWPIHRQHRSTVSLCFTDLLWKSGGKAAENRKPCPSLRDRHPVLCRLPGTLFPRGIERNGRFLSFCRRDFTYTGQDIAHFAALQLDRLRLDLFRQNKKNTWWVTRPFSLFAQRSCRLRLQGCVVAGGEASG